MRKRLLMFIASSATLLSAYAGAEIVWLEQNRNLGAFDENDGEVTCDYRFVNVGNEPLTILSVRTSCGCTTSKPPKRPIMPGDTAFVSATYNPTGRPGRFEKKIYVTSNTTPETTTLTISGVVIGSSNTLRSRYPVDAGSIKLRSKVLPFGDVKKGTAKNYFLEIYNATSDTISPIIENVPSYLRATAAAKSIPPGELLGYSISLLADKAPLYGIISDSLSLRGKPDEPPVKIDIVANIIEDFSNLSEKQLEKAPRLSFGDKMVDFGTFRRTEKTSRTFTIDNHGKDPLMIRRIYTSDPGISLSIDKTKIKKDGSATVTIDIDMANLDNELLNGRIVVISNDPRNPVTYVRVVGIPE